MLSSTCIMLRLYKDVRRLNPLTKIREVTMSENHVVPYDVGCRLKQHIHSMFVSNYFGVRRELSLRVSITPMVILVSDGNFDCESP